MPISACLAAIVLLLDVSASVPDSLYVAQRDGTAAAFDDPRLIRVIEKSDGIAVLMAEFAYAATTRVGWTMIRTGDDARRFATTLRSASRSESLGMTAIGHAVWHAWNELAVAPCAPQVQLIDVSTDGAETTSRLPAQTLRDEAASAGIIINAIVFNSYFGEDAETLVPMLLREAEGWLRKHIATGFVRVVAGAEGFADAFRNKVVFEVAELSRLTP